LIRFIYNGSIFFFFKQKTAYEIMPSLVGSEMCIRDRFTPPLYAGALRGITRGVVLELAEKSGIPVSETNITRYDLFNADECFLTGTGAEIIPVVKIDGRIIGSGSPGSVTTRLIKDYHHLTNSSGTPIYE